MNPKIRLTLASILAVVALGAIAPAANAYVYWTNIGIGTIGRANLDGTGANQSFITGNLSSPYGVAVDGNYVYWINGPNMVTMDSSIGRANLNGTGVNQFFITGTSFPVAVAVDNNYVYWTNTSGTIGRANLNGTGVNQSFITGATDPVGLAVDNNYVYWTNSGNGTVGRANVSGTGVNQSFITGATSPYGVSADNNYVYWTNDDSVPTIGRANLNGTGVNQSFITGATDPFGLAVDPIPYPSPIITRAAKPTKRSLKVKVGCGDASACSLRLTGKKVGTGAAITPKTVSVGTGEQPTVTLTYTRALKKALTKGGRVSVTVTNPVSGGTNSIVVQVAR